MNSGKYNSKFLSICLCEHAANTLCECLEKNAFTPNQIFYTLNPQLKSAVNTIFDHNNVLLPPAYVPFSGM